ncbi:hypothetical protein JOM56_010215 [Amanita muscaria]
MWGSGEGQNGLNGNVESRSVVGVLNICHPGSQRNHRKSASLSLQWSKGGEASHAGEGFQLTPGLAEGVSDGCFASCRLPMDLKRTRLLVIRFSVLVSSATKDWTALSVLSLEMSDHHGKTVAFKVLPGAIAIPPASGLHHFPSSNISAEDHNRCPLMRPATHLQRPWVDKASSGGIQEVRLQIRNQRCQKRCVSAMVQGKQAYLYLKPAGLPSVLREWSNMVWQKLQAESSINPLYHQYDYTKPELSDVIIEEKVSLSYSFAPSAFPEGKMVSTPVWTVPQAPESCEQSGILATAVAFGVVGYYALPMLIIN